jgi:hypothetical protein
MSTTVAPRSAKRAARSGVRKFGRGQNSAGRYPLISRPMQISTRVGVVQAICRPSLAFQSSNKLDRGTPSRKPRNHTGGIARPSHGAPRDNSSGVSLKPIRCLEAPATSLSP